MDFGCRILGTALFDRQRRIAFLNIFGLQRSPPSSDNNPDQLSRGRLIPVTETVDFSASFIPNLRRREHSSKRVSGILGVMSRTWILFLAVWAISLQNGRYSEIFCTAEEKSRRKWTHNTYLMSEAAVSGLTIFFYPLFHLTVWTAYLSKTRYSEVLDIEAELYYLILPSANKWHSLGHYAVEWPMKVVVNIYEECLLRRKMFELD